MAEVKPGQRQRLLRSRPLDLACVRVVALRLRLMSVTIPVSLEN